MMHFRRAHQNPRYFGAGSSRIPCWQQYILSNICGIQFWRQISLDKHDDTVKEGIHKSEASSILYFVVNSWKCCHLRATRPFSASSASLLRTRFYLTLRCELPVIIPSLFQSKNDDRQTSKRLHWVGCTWLRRLLECVGDWKLMLRMLFKLEVC